MRKKTPMIASVLGLIIICILLANRETKIKKDYKIGVVYTSLDRSKSDIAAYSSEGEKIDEARIRIGGVNSANFDKSTVHEGDKIYYSMPVLGIRSQDFMIELNTQDGSYTKVRNQDKNAITSFAVDETYGYLSNSSLATTYFTKVSLSDSSLSQKIELEGSCKLTRIFGDELALFCNLDDTTVRMYLMEKNTLEVKCAVDLLDVNFITDAVFYENSYYILVNRDGEDLLSNRMIKVDGTTYASKELTMPFDNLLRIYQYQDKLYIIESSYHGIEIGRNRIAVFDTRTEEVNTFETENNHIVTDLADGKLYSTDAESVYIYDLETMVLENSFKLEQKKNRMITGIFAK